MVAEGLGDTSFQCALIIFDDEQVMAVAIADVLTEVAPVEWTYEHWCSRSSRWQRSDHFIHWNTGDN